MILSGQLTYIRDKFITSSWSNPGLETNIHLVPTLLTGRFQAVRDFDVMGMSVCMPDNTTLFELYTMEYLPSEVFRASYQQVDCWIRLDEFCNTNNAFIYPSYDNCIQTVRYSDSFICYLSNGTLLFATKYREDLAPYRSDLSLYLRSSNDSLNVDIDVCESILTTYDDISQLLSDYAAHANKDELTVFIDGIYHNTLELSDLQLGMAVTIVKDSSLIHIQDQPIQELKTYHYNNKPYYLVDLSKTDTDQMIYSHHDAALYLCQGKRGRLLVFLTDESSMQVTNTIIGISVDYIERLSADMYWTLDACSLRIFTKHGSPQQYYVNNDNYWNAINGLDYNIKTMALSNEIPAPEVLTAAWHQGSAYNKLLDCSYMDLTVETLDKSLAVSTWDYYINRTMVEADIYGNNITNIPPGTIKQEAIYSYNNGLVDKFKPTSVDETNNAIMLGYVDDYRSSEGKVVPLKDYNAYAVYDITLADEPQLLQLDTDYKILNDAIHIEDHVGKSLVIDLNTTYIRQVSYDRRHIPIKDINPRLGFITVVIGNRTLVPNIDYHIHQDNLILWKASIKASGEATIIYQPTLVAGDVIIESGFIYDNRINISGNYLAYDPSNYYILYNGQVILPNQLQWDNPFITSTGVFTNAGSFAVVRPLLSNTNHPVEMLTARTDSLTKLSEIGLFKDQYVPFPKPDYSLYPERYELVSIFMSEVTRGVIEGTIDCRPSMLANFGLDEILKDYLHIFSTGIDACGHDLDWSVIELRAHGLDTPLDINGDMYSFLSKVNHTYLDARIQMNHNFRIQA